MAHKWLKWLSAILYRGLYRKNDNTPIAPKTGQKLVKRDNGATHWSIVSGAMKHTEVTYV